MSSPQFPASHPYANLPLVLFTGVGRSGTAALRSALARHPRLHSTDSENNIVGDVLAAAKRNCTAPSRRQAMRVSPARYNELFRGVLLELLWPESRTPLPAAIGAFSGLGAADAEFLRQVFPGARVLHLVRSGIEVMGAQAIGGANATALFEAHCDAWAASLALIDWGRGRSGAGRPDYLMVRHEHLLDAHEAQRVMSEVWRFAGLAPCAEAVEHLRGEIEGAAEIGGTKDGGRRERWREWTLEQRQGFERLCGEGMKRLGYEIPWLVTPVVIPRKLGVSAKAAV